MTSPSRPRLSAGKQIAFTIVTVVGVFALLEGALTLFGVTPIADEEDPYVGFSSYLPLFSERDGPNGRRFVTAPNKLSWFNRQRFPVEKAPGTYRVFCMGGSTTYGHPYDDVTSFAGWLRELLPAADSTHTWEVINAGGVSYASYRVVKLMEEFVRYEPDLFIVYTGENEFLERRTYAHIFETPPAVRWLGSALGRTRVYSGLRRLLKRDDAPVAPAAAPTAGSGDGDSDATTLAAEVEAMLDKSVGPSSYYRDDAFREQVLEHLRFSLGRIVDLAEESGARVVFVLPASNLGACSPFKSEHRDGLQPAEHERLAGIEARARAAADGGEWDAALAAWDEALAIDDRYAAYHYERGRALRQLERFDDALRAFTRARDEDICPLRALTEAITIVREVAQQRNVPWIDFVDLVKQESEHGIPDDQLFLDHLHPTIDGHRMLAVALTEELIRGGVVHPGDAWPDEAVRAATERVESRLDPEAHANALRNLAKVLGWAGKFEEADDLSLRVVELLPGDAEAIGLAGYAYQRRNDLDTAIAHYEEAIRLNPDNFRVHYLLASCAQQTGDLERAERHFLETVRLDPTIADAWAELGAVHIEFGQRERARVELEKALSLDPGHAGARAALARL